MRCQPAHPGSVGLRAEVRYAGACLIRPASDPECRSIWLGVCEFADGGRCRPRASGTTGPRIPAGGPRGPLRPFGRLSSGEFVNLPSAIVRPGNRINHPPLPTPLCSRHHSQSQGPAHQLNQNTPQSSRTQLPCPSSFAPSPARFLPPSAEGASPLSQVRASCHTASSTRFVGHIILSTRAQPMLIVLLSRCAALICRASTICGQPSWRSRTGLAAQRPASAPDHGREGKRMPLAIELRKFCLC